MTSSTSSLSRLLDEYNDFSLMSNFNHRSLLIHDTATMLCLRSQLAFSTFCPALPCSESTKCSWASFACETHIPSSRFCLSSPALVPPPTTFDPTCGFEGEGPPKGSRKNLPFSSFYQVQHKSLLCLQICCVYVSCSASFTPRCTINTISSTCPGSINPRIC